MKPICLIIGAGAGIGGNVGKRFAQAGYHAVLCRRSDEADSTSLSPKSRPPVDQPPATC